MGCNFLLTIFNHLFITKKMSAPTRQDLDDAISALGVQANSLHDQAVVLQSSAQNAANRVSALPVESNDFTVEVDLVSQVSASLASTAGVLTATQGIVDGIAPSTP
jgi:hypothetical protein